MKTRLSLALILALGLSASPLYAQDEPVEEAAADAAMEATDEAADEAELDAAAEEAVEEKNWSLTGSLVSDYVFRGVSQTQERPTLQLGWEYEWDSGFYVGLWGSGVDFTPSGTPIENDADESIELDYLVGYRHSFSDTLAGDVQIARYDYPGLAGGFNFTYNELIGKLTWNDQYTFTLGYTNDLLNSGETGLYFGGAGSWDMPWEMSLNASLGYTVQDDIEGLDNYADWSLGLSRDCGPFNIGLAYVDTDGNGHDIYGDLGDSRVVLTISAGL